MHLFQCDTETGVVLEHSTHKTKKLRARDANWTGDRLNFERAKGAMVNVNLYFSIESSPKL